MVLDNNSLNKILTESTETFTKTNQLVSKIMSTSTLPLRYPSFMLNNLMNIINVVIPIPSFHFLTTAYTPLDDENEEIDYKKSTSFEVMRRLLSPNHTMVSNDINAKQCYISILDIIQGEINPADIHKSLEKIRQKLEFVPWGQRSIQCFLSKKSPFLTKTNSVNGLMLSNQTSIATVMFVLLILFLTRALFLVIIYSSCFKVFLMILKN